jgi:transposase
MRDLTVDGAGELNNRSSELGKVVKEYQINQRTTKPYSPWQNKAESEIREIKKGIHQAMHRTGSQYPLWDYCGHVVACQQYAD